MMADMANTPTLPAGAPDGEGADDRRQAIDALERSFSELIAVFRQFIVAAADRAHPGMLPGTYKVLSTIHRLGPITLSALAERSSADKGMLSRTVSELEGLGFVERTADPSDKRSRLIAVTPLGAERMEAARAPHQGRLAEVLEDWSVRDIEHVTTLLHALANGQTPEQSQSA